MKKPDGKRRLIALALALLTAFPVPAASPAVGFCSVLVRTLREGQGQNQSILFGPTPSPQPTRAPYSPAPYREDEFPQELKDIRRAEVIALGAVPITYLFSSMFYDIGRYAWLYATDSPDASNKLPFSTASDRFDSDEIAGLLVTSVIIGGVIALLDNIIITDRRSKAKAETQRLEKLRAERESQLDTPAPLESSSAGGDTGASPGPRETPPPPEGTSPGPGILSTPLPSPLVSPYGP